jgi:hypothetical protein
VSTHDDARTLAHAEARGKPGDALVAERLAPERQAADYGRLFARIDAAAQATDTFAVLAADVHGRDEAIAVAVCDGADRTREFIERFVTDHVPAIWPALTTVVVTAWPLDPDDAETVESLRGLPRGRWLLRDDRAPHGLRDPAIRPHTAGAARAARRRGEAP